MTLDTYYSRKPVPDFTSPIPGAVPYTQKSPASIRRQLLEAIQRIYLSMLSP